MRWRVTVTFNLNRVKAELYKLTWFEMEQIDYVFDLPILIDRRGYVLLGNSIKNQVINNETVEAIVVSVDDYMKGILYEIESVVVGEGSLDRFRNIEAELKNYLADFDRKFEVLSLFDDEELRETRLVTEDNFIKPPAYNFDKGTKKADNSDDLDDDDIFNLLERMSE